MVRQNLVSHKVILIVVISTVYLSPVSAQFRIEGKLGSFLKELGTGNSSGSWGGPVRNGDDWSGRILSRENRRAYTEPVCNVVPVGPGDNSRRPPAAERVQEVSSPSVSTTTQSHEIRMARNKTDVARAYFRTHQYAEAKQRLDDVVRLVPNDTNAYQFRSLVHFALGDFEAAAADAYDALQSGNAWTSDVLNAIYPSSDRYYQHLKALELKVTSSPSMHVHFLAAYHNLMLGDLANGRGHLELALTFAKGEPLISQLLAVVNQNLAQASEAKLTESAAK